MVQPAVARAATRARDGDPAARTREPVRLRGRLVRPRGRGRDRGLRAGLPGRRGRLAEEAARPPRAGARTRSGYRRLAPRGAPGGREASTPRRRARRAAPATVARRGRARAPTARVRRAPRPPARARADDRRPRAGARRAVRATGRPPRRLSVGASLRADRRPAARDRRARRRPRPLDADAPPAPGRRRLGARRSSRCTRSCGPSRGSPGRLDGADGDARRAALPHDRVALRRPRDSVVLLTSSLRAREHAHARQLIASGDASLVVGTHALIQQEVDFRDLSVVVVDEQHRFGVGQRSALAEGRSPHVLHMTATPIPRTLALTVYGDLDVCELTVLPGEPQAGDHALDPRGARLRGVRAPHPAAPRGPAGVRRLSADRAVGDEPRPAAEHEAARLRGEELRDFRVGCVHGKLRPGDRRDLMARFKAGELDVLVATTVIEVGVDVPNATVMIVQEADRFGLAQLHQLRGRVGTRRRAVVLPARLAAAGGAHRERRRAARSDGRTTDGFELAERDLEIRGEGQLLGARQSGFSDLRFVRLRRTTSCSSERATPPRPSTTKGCSPTTSIACSAKPSTSASRSAAATAPLPVFAACESSPARGKGIASPRRAVSSRARPVIACGSPPSS